MKMIIGPDAITSYRRLAYSPWHAIAEFVDNSTQSYFDNQAVLDEHMKDEEDKILTVSIVYDRQAGMLRITDNAMGMSGDDLEHALHVARPPVNTTGRSKYGMGMKTAACWMGDQWTITTKKLGEKYEHYVVVDVNKVAEDHQDGVVHKHTLKPEERHYTIVTVVSMNRKFHGRTLGKIADFLRSMYRSDLRKGILSLRWQDGILTWDSFDERLLVAANGKKYRKDFEFDVDGKKVRGWVGVLDKGSRADAGFSILQANRVVKGWPDAWRPSRLYGQLQGSNDLVNQRLVGEIHLDGFDVSHTKDNILWRDSQEEDVETGLKEHCTDYRDFAKKRRKAGDDQRGPNEAAIRIALDDIEKDLTSPEMVDRIQISTIPPPEVIGANKERTINSIVTTWTPTLQGTINSRPPISWKIFLQEMSPNDPYVVSDSTKRDEIIVIVNRSHPYFCTQLAGPESLRDYLRQCIYDSVAEWHARAKTSGIDPDTIKLLKDGLLRVPIEMESHSDESTPTEDTT